MREYQESAHLRDLRTRSRQGVAIDDKTRKESKNIRDVVRRGLGGVSYNLLLVGFIVTALTTDMFLLGVELHSHR